LLIAIHPVLYVKKPFLLHDLMLSSHLGFADSLVNLEKSEQCEHCNASRGLAGCAGDSLTD